MSLGFVLTPQQVVELPVDELALRILQDIDRHEGRPNRHNWLNAAIQGGAYGHPDGPAIRALAEAWNWLFAKGLVGPDPSQGSSDWVFITRLGKKVLEEGLSPVAAVDRLSLDLHPILERKVRRQFLMGEYELAAFAAMRAVEIQVRELAGGSDSDTGVKFIRRVFGENGLLRDPNADGGEQVATMELFAGAIGVFKNPGSHREVKFDDPTEAAEVILFADLLLRILDRIGLLQLVRRPN